MKNTTYWYTKVTPSGLRLLFLGSYFVSSLAFAEVSTPATLASDSDAPAVSYLQALEFYKQKNYPEAYQAFLKLVATDYGNVNYNYYLGRSAFFVQDYHEAIGAYERILTSYPNNERAKLELGRLYYERHEYIQSQRYLNEVLNSNAPEAVKNNIRVYLAKMGVEDKTNQEHHNTVKATLLGSLFYDSNINYSPQSDQFQLPSGSLSFPSDIGAWGSEQLLAINHRYDNPKTLGFAIKNDVTLYNRLLPGQSDYNILYGSYMPALSWHKSGWTTDAALFLDDMNYGKNPYLMSYGIAPTVSYMPNTTQLVSAQLKWLKKDYQSAVYRPRNAQYTQLMLTYQKTVGALFSWYGQGVFEKEQKDQSSAAVNVDYQALTARTGINYLLLQSLNVSAAAEFQQKSFLENDYVLKSFGETQKQADSKMSLTLGVAKNFEKSLTAELKLNVIQNNSTIKLYEYQKSALTFNLIKRF